MIGIGEGIAIMSICAPVTVAIIKLCPARSNGRQTFCPEHHHLSQSVNEAREDMKKVHEKINQVAQDVAKIRGYLEK
jgi:hypothetical protein